MHSIDQLRQNLHAVGVFASEADLEGIVAKGFISRLPDFRRLIGAGAGDLLPDYLDQSALPLPAAGLAASALPASADSDTIAGVTTQLRARAVSPVELAEQALARLAERDPQLNAFQLVIAERALADARRAEGELAAGELRGPLHGVPVAVKDLLDLEGTPSAAGSKIRADLIATGDATAVARLRAAGAVIIGKTRMPEFAYSPGSNNPHYGPTPNPYAADRDSGGSSSGSGAAVAAGIVYAALGTDTGGSIRIPAAHCGVVGLKPTYGRASLAGAVTLSWSLDHIGPLARSVADAAIMLAAIAGRDPRDGRTMGRTPYFAAGGLDAGVRGLRVVILRDDGTSQPLASAEQLAALRRGVAALAAAGAELVELDIPELDALRVISGAILAMEAGALHLPDLRTRLADYGEFMRQRVLAAFVYGPGDFVQAQQQRTLLRQRCAAIFEQVDLLALPCQPDIAPPLGVPAPTSFTLPFNGLGWPAISLPAGLGAAGLPLSLQLVAGPWHEPILLRAAYAVEQTIGAAKIAG